MAYIALCMGVKFEPNFNKNKKVKFWMLFKLSHNILHTTCNNNKMADESLMKYAEKNRQVYMN